MCDLVFAAFLLTTPAGTYEPTPPDDRWVAVTAGLQKLAIDWEILDKREAGYVLTKKDEFNNDVNMLRRRLSEFADAPKLVEQGRLPDRQTANDLIRLNRDYRKQLDDRRILELDRAEELTSVVRETDQLYQVWDAIRDARCEFYYVTVRRQALKKIRDMVGDPAYMASKMPPALPTWHIAGE